MYHERFRITAGADTDFSETLSRHTSSLRLYARRLAGNTVDADDLVQETMLRCWSARKSFQVGSNFAAWSRVVMRNCFLSSHRNDRFHVHLPDEAFDRIPATQGRQDQAVELLDVEWALEQLHPDQRKALILAAKGFSIEEAAGQLAIAEGTFKSRVARGRLHLRELVDDPNALKYGAPKMGPTYLPKQRNWKGVMIG